MFKNITETSVGEKYRALVVGPPNSFKTTSLWRTVKRPVHIISFPGEKGWQTIPKDEPGVTAYVFEAEDPTSYSPGAIVKELETLTFDILAGKKGEIATFAGDGIHKLYQFYWEREYRRLRAAYPDMDEEKLRGRSYGDAHKEFSLYLTKVDFATVPVALFSCWDGSEKDNPSDMRMKAPTHIYPDLPGQLAKRIMGEFTIVVYSRIGSPPLRGETPCKWLTRPVGEVWGAGIKMPFDIITKIPNEIPQNWERLFEMLQGKGLEEVTVKSPGMKVIGQTPGKVVLTGGKP